MVSQQLLGMTTPKWQHLQAGSASASSGRSVHVATVEVAAAGGRPAADKPVGYLHGTTRPSFARRAPGRLSLSYWYDHPEENEERWNIEYSSGRRCSYSEWAPARWQRRSCISPRAGGQCPARGAGPAPVPPGPLPAAALPHVSSAAPAPHQR